MYISIFSDELYMDIYDALPIFKEWGITHVDFRGRINGKTIEKQTDEELYAIRAKLDEAGISLSSLGSPCGKFDIKEDFEIHLEAFRRALAACRILGTDKMRMFSFFVEKDDLDTYRDEVIRRLKIMLEEAKDSNKQNIINIYERVVNELKMATDEEYERLRKTIFKE